MEKRNDVQSTNYCDGFVPKLLSHIGILDPNKYRLRKVDDCRTNIGA